MPGKLVDAKAVVLLSPCRLDDAVAPVEVLLQEGLGVVSVPAAGPLTPAMLRALLVTTSFGASRMSATRCATASDSISVKPRVVIAGLPMRMPEVTNGFSGSFGIVFLLTVMCAPASAVSASLPVIFFARRSTRNRCESVPPDQWRKAVADRQKELDTCGG